ncbi:hypothetical protein PHYSODRAFT_300247 [Phytophthora sojae]|nr:hypothetical protein PHYSODRAFT_300247 [Phytophthora sojae]EGZ17049.1 hypothetical protein PHYSODRAFT_300247 [Phytophthora sojae]|eukprot:XP_009526107.1 hypothetical protein PHYSODRAFT_300247 [Phytophthora sojae]
MGKTALAKNYIFKCRETWPPGKREVFGLHRDLCQCRTIFLRLASAGDAITIETANQALAQAVGEQLQPGTDRIQQQLGPFSVSGYVKRLVKEVSPLFIVIDDLERLFQSHGRFIQFCRNVLWSWMQTRQIHLLVLSSVPLFEGKKYDIRVPGSVCHR